MSQDTHSLTSIPTSVDMDGAVHLARLLVHFRNPQNLLNYLALSAWAKFMGISEYIPTITIG